MTGTDRVNPVLRAIRTRRVVRTMSDQPVAREQIEAVLDAGRYAPSAGNRHLHRFVATSDPAILRVLRMVSPGMIQRPAAAVTICIDQPLAVEYGFARTSPGLYVDVGTIAATMLLAAHGIGLGAGPVSSFSRAAVGVVLRLPEGWSPELVVCLGHPATEQPPPMGRRPSLSWRDLTRWVVRGPADEEQRADHDREA
ncbi:nitroreductase family protein [Pseudonocardia bannensis]|uniref:Nitroreductase family protein n=1 Tax=Pseudonocardia bannensis TaxID=630973 RepID=A0A848DEA6_9PSEU|nr:nitroreductase family protein [Pseudonocardia bannensis]NMH90916.1 nitroreductase family protein [Pseudonocardia bannensis]